MEDVRKELAGIIEQEIEVHEGLLRALARQEEILVQGRHADLEENLRGLEELRWRARELRRDREVSKEKLARWMRVEQEKVTLRDLAEGGGRDGEGLLRLRDRLVEAARRVRTATRKNMMLIRQALELNRELAACMQGVAPPPVATYGQTGAVREDQRGGLVDAEV